MPSVTSRPRWRWDRACHLDRIGAITGVIGHHIPMALEPHRDVVVVRATGGMNITLTRESSQLRRFEVVPSSSVTVYVKRIGPIEARVRGIRETAVRIQSEGAIRHITDERGVGRQRPIRV